MIFIVLTLVCIATNMQAVTLVYNLRVRRIFNAPIILEQLKKPRTLVSAVPIYFSRKSHITNERTGIDVQEKRTAGGALFNARFVPSKHWWAEITTGLETDRATFEGNDAFRAARTGLDDIVFTGGYRHFVKNRAQFVAYGLVGIPTRRTITRCDRYTPLVGTRIFSLGFGAEGSCSFFNELKRSLAVIGQYRLIHGFNRNWFPILPKGSRIQPGNVQDLLLTLQYREKRTLFEIGYNATFFTDQAIILPTETIDTETFSRHGGYAILSHGWLDAFFGKPFVCGVGINTSHSKQFDARTVTAWIYGAIVF